MSLESQLQLLWQIFQAQNPNHPRTLLDIIKTIELEPEEMAEVINQTIPHSPRDIPIRIYKPSRDPALPLLLYFHGGGFVTGSLDSHDIVCRRLAKQVNCIVISVDYRLAPQHPFPAATDDAFRALQWAHESATALGADPENLAVAGDSAGGNLAAVVSLMARDLKGPRICYQVLIYPVLDFTAASESFKKFRQTFFIPEEQLLWYVKRYVPPGVDLKLPYLSPIFAEDLSNLPPALVITAEYDPLVDEGKQFAELLSQAEIPVQYQHYQGVIHGFFQMPKLTQKATEAMELVVGELRNAFT